MLPFIICLLIKKSKEGHILCRLVHNGLKIFFANCAILCFCNKSFILGKRNFILFTLPNTQKKLHDHVTTRLSRQNTINVQKSHKLRYKSFLSVAPSYNHTTSRPCFKNSNLQFIYQPNQHRNSVSTAMQVVLC